MLSWTPLRRFADERGQSLVLALLVLTFLAVSLGTVMFFTAGNQRNSNYQKTAQVATSLAEAGVNNAVSVLANPSNSCCLAVPPGTTGAVLPGPAPATPASQTYNGNTVTWWGSLNSSATWNGQPGAVVWTVYGKASVPNPTGPNAAPVVKQVSAQVLVHAPTTTNFPVGVWNTVFSPFGPSAGCDTTIGQGINIAVPVYVGGNLCMGQNATISKPVYVGGFLFFNNKQGSIGSNGATINSAHVGGYCQVQVGATQVNPCKSEPQPASKATNIWVTGAPTDLTGPASDLIGVSAPDICWDGNQGAAACGSNTPAGGWYAFASPGPLHPCGTVLPGQTITPAFDSTAPVFSGQAVYDEAVQPHAGHELHVQEPGPGRAVMGRLDPHAHRRRHHLLRRQHHGDDVRQPADHVQGLGQRWPLHAERRLSVRHLRERRSQGL